MTSTAPESTRFTVMLREADRFTHNGDTLYAFYVLPTDDAGPLKANHCYLLTLSEKMLQHERYKAVVALARPGQPLHLDVDDLTLSAAGEIWFKHLNEVRGRRLNEKVM